MINKYKLIILSLICSVFLFSSCEEDQNHFKIKGNLENVEGGYFYAAKEINNSLSIDTVRVDENGKFSFEGVIDTLTVVSLYFNQNTKSTYILIDKGWDISLNGDVLFPDLIEVKGGDINDDLTEFKKSNYDLFKSRANIYGTVEENKGSSKLLSELQNVNFELSNLAADYVSQNPEKIASVMLINNFFKDESTLDRLDENLEKLRGEARIFPLRFALVQFSARVKRSLVGASAPLIKGKTIKGDDLELFSKKGKNYTLLSFVATTCEMCDTERKPVVETYEALKKEKRNIDFVTILMDTEIEPISQNAKDSIKWDTLPIEGSWSSPVVGDYNISEIPYYILVSPEGKILKRDFPIRKLAAILDNLEPKK